MWLLVPGLVMVLLALSANMSPERPPVRAVTHSRLGAATSALSSRPDSDGIRTRAPPELSPLSVVLVTGGAGFVGFHLAKRLHRDRIKVISLDNFNPYYSTALKHARESMLQELGVEVVRGDMCDEPMVAELITRHGVTHVASMAAQAGVRYSLSSPHTYTKYNVECFVSLLETLRRTPDVKLIYASSSSVYGANTEVPFSEAHRVDSQNSLYAATKKANEAIAHVYHGLYGIPGKCPSSPISFQCFFSFPPGCRGPFLLHFGSISLHACSESHDQSRGYDSSPSMVHGVGLTWRTFPSRIRSHKGFRSPSTATASPSATSRTLTTLWTASSQRSHWDPPKRSSTWATIGLRACCTL